MLLHHRRASTRGVQGGGQRRRVSRPRGEVSYCGRRLRPYHSARARSALQTSVRRAGALSSRRAADLGRVRDRDVRRVHLACGSTTCPRVADGDAIVAPLSVCVTVTVTVILGPPAPRAPTESLRVISALSGCGIIETCQNICGCAQPKVMTAAALGSALSEVSEAPSIHENLLGSPTWAVQVQRPKATLTDRRS